MEKAMTRGTNIGNAIFAIASPVGKDGYIESDDKGFGYAFPFIGVFDEKKQSHFYIGTKFFHGRIIAVQSMRLRDDNSFTTKIPSMSVDKTWSKLMKISEKLRQQIIRHEYSSTLSDLIEKMKEKGGMDNNQTLYEIPEIPSAPEAPSVNVPIPRPKVPKSSSTPLPPISKELYDFALKQANER